MAYELTMSIQRIEEASELGGQEITVQWSDGIPLWFHVMFAAIVVVMQCYVLIVVYRIGPQHVHMQCKRQELDSW